MKSVDEYVRRNGLDALLNEIESIVEDESEPHEFPQRTDVDMDDWFGFLFKFEEATSQTWRHSTLVMPRFNYISVEKQFTRYVRDNSPVSYEKTLDYVLETVDSVDNKKQVSRWMEFSTIEFDQDTVVSVEPKCAEL